MPKPMTPDDLKGAAEIVMSENMNVYRVIEDSAKLWEADIARIAEARAGWKDELESHKVTTALAVKLAGEVARLTALLQEWLDGDEDDNAETFESRVRAALRGDTAPEPRDIEWERLRYDPDPKPTQPKIIYTGDTAPAQ